LKFFVGICVSQGCQKSDTHFISDPPSIVYVTHGLYLKTMQI